VFKGLEPVWGAIPSGPNTADIHSAYKKCARGQTTRPTSFPFSLLEIFFTSKKFAPKIVFSEEIFKKSKTGSFRKNSLK
jgi:hypothetical protein